MEIIRYSELKPQPWRNGGGVTRELASHPEAASAQDGAWDWRVSIAEISKAGPFSPFVGTDRVLTVIEGELLLLNVDGAEQPLEKHRPFRFSGDALSSATLPTGNVQALNVVTRKGSFKGYTSIIELSKKRAHPVFGGQLGVLLQGQATVSPGGTASSGTSPATASDGGPEPLGRYDAVVGSDTETPEILGRGFLAVVSIDRVDPAAAAD
ncbi:HutD/Ves family protein [Arthrobacter rhizosphaerae]|uniref:HutD/Ves family protein n=1 Tax=Arthrobacter rhizosphaerae TaxID=2855490 RepID=UPI001FF5081A|nr:HutD family protein [Arthrobacter rhizosphaerae]